MLKRNAKLAVIKSKNGIHKIKIEIIIEDWVPLFQQVRY